MLLTILFMPLIGSLLCGLGGWFFGRKGAPFLSILCLFSSFLTLNFFFALGNKGIFNYAVNLGCWFKLPGHIVNWYFYIDSLGFYLLSTVLFCSLCIHVYSLYYMATDPHIVRFFCYLSLFTFFMELLICSGNFILFFFGWEGIGLCSYLLINFWYTRPRANQAALKAMVINKISDIILLIAISLIYNNFLTLNFKSANLLAPYSIKIYWFNDTSVSAVGLIAFCLFLSAAGKSAQLFLHVWLTDAMEGPTPVSALIHAATLVTAGVFLVLRTLNFFLSCPSLFSVFLLASLATAFFSAVCGCNVNDLKKSIAYSTCSQIALIFMGIYEHLFDLSFFHLLNHAYFKALLFLISGIYIHKVNDQQDIRYSGVLLNNIQQPLIYSLFIGASFSLMALCFFSGSYSKEPLVVWGHKCLLVDAGFLDFLLDYAIFLSSYYTFAGLCSPYYSGVPRLTTAKVNRPFFFSYFSLFSLFIFSIFSGFFLQDIFYPITGPTGLFFSPLAEQTRPELPEEGLFSWSNTFGSKTYLLYCPVFLDPFMEYLAEVKAGRATTNYTSELTLNVDLYHTGTLGGLVNSVPLVISISAFMLWGFFSQKEEFIPRIFNGHLLYLFFKNSVFTRFFFLTLNSFVVWLYTLLWPIVLDNLKLIFKCFLFYLFLRRISRIVFSPVSRIFGAAEGFSSFIFLTDYSLDSIFLHSTKYLFREIIAFLDKGFFETIGPEGFARIFYLFILNWQSLYHGYFYNAILGFLIYFWYLVLIYFCFFS